MKKIVLVLAVVLVVASAVNAANVPSGVTGLWRFQTSADKLKATIGVDLTTSSSGNSYWYSGPWTRIGTTAQPDLYTDGGVVQERSWDYLSVNPSFTANGGGSYVNQYTVSFDYCQTNLTGNSYNSLFQTSWGGNDSDGDLFIWSDGSLAQSEVGIGDVGYSGEMGSYSWFDASKWHRYVLSVDNGDDTGAGGFFRVYLDGALILDGSGQGRDGRMSLYPDRFNLFADDSWEDAWGLVGTVATWNRTLSTSEVAGMGGWINGAAEPTPLVIPEPATMSLLALGGIALLRRNRK